MKDKDKLYAEALELAATFDFITRKDLQAALVAALYEALLWGESVK